MKHYGDITMLSGYELPIVDVITGGSPCQDLSVAGKRAGLAGERSGLFMEQIRIVKEMRERDRAAGRTAFLVRPRYMVWENVDGARTSPGGSKKGQDFAAVIEEIVKICEQGAGVCVCVPDGGWTKSGCYYAADGAWSIAWRVHDARFWGVPQRRKRIALVADFGGLSAPEILFERQGLSWNPKASGTEGERTPNGTEGSADRAISFQERAGKPGGGKGILIQNERTGALSTLNNQSVFCLQGNTIDRDAKQNGNGISKEVAHTLNAVDRHGVACFNPWDSQSARVYEADGIWHSLNANENGGQSRDGVFIPGTEPTVYDARGNGDGVIVPTITGDHENRVTDYTAICVGNGQLNQISMAEQANTLDTMHDQQAVMCFQNTGRGWWNEGDVGATLRTPCGGDSTKANLVAAVDCRNGTENEEINGTLQAKERGQNLNSNNVCRIGPRVRRLTPMECERLQGFPDGWTDIGEWVDTKGKRHKEADSPRYKALGNSIALPFWQYLARRICAQYERDITMGSLFDGIGGFPLVFERCGAKAVWASEIEEFCIAVTKLHFPEE